MDTADVITVVVTIAVAVFAVRAGGLWAMRASRESADIAARQQAYLGVLQAIRRTHPSPAANLVLRPSFSDLPKGPTEIQAAAAVQLADRREMVRQMESLHVALQLAGSRDVLKAFTAYGQRWEELTDARKRLDEPWASGTYSPDAYRSALDAIDAGFESAFDAFAEVCRRDIHPGEETAGYQFAGYGRRSHHPCRTVHATGDRSVSA